MPQDLSGGNCAANTFRLWDTSPACFAPLAFIPRAVAALEVCGGDGNGSIQGGLSPPPLGPLGGPSQA